MKRSFLFPAAILLFFLLNSGFALAGQVVFSETFDSLESIRNNGGTFNPVQSSFESGLAGSALHTRNGEFVEYALTNIEELNEGSIDFYFKIFDERNERGGLVNIQTGGTGRNIMAFASPVFYNLWLELATGGFHQYHTGSDISSKKWHHAALVWKCGQKKGTFFNAYLDGTTGWRKVKILTYCKDLTFLKPFLMKVGRSFWYGATEAVFDDLKIYDYALSKKEIKARANLVENDPDKGVIELLSPSDGSTVDISEDFLDLRWTGPAAYYSVQISTQPNFAKENTISIKTYSTWTTSKFKELISANDLRELLDKTNYNQTLYYWRLAIKQGKQTSYSYPQSVNII